MTDTAPNTEENTDATGEVADMASPDLATEVEKWKTLARKHEERAKANAKAATELTEIKQSMLSETEKAIEEARRESRQQTVAEFAGKLVDAKLQAVLSGKTLEANAILSFDKSKFVTEVGEIDEDAIAQWVESNTAQPETTYPDLAQGQRGSVAALNGDPLLADLKAKLGIN